MAELQEGPIAIEAVQRIDALFAIERGINGASAEQRQAVRDARSRPLIDNPENYHNRQRLQSALGYRTAAEMEAQAA